MDERRIPGKGAKMRCPKCTTTFRVQPDGSTAQAAQKQTEVGLGAVTGRPPKKTEVGIAPPPPAKREEPNSPTGSPPVRTERGGEAYADLPKAVEPRGSNPSMEELLDLPRPSPLPQGPAPTEEAELPAPRRSSKPADPFPDDEVDLPMLRTSQRPRVDPPPSLSSDNKSEVDLPALRASDKPEVDLPKVRASDSPAGGAIDLPVVKGVSSIPAGARGDGPDTDLPAPVQSVTDLPIPVSQEDLPKAGRSSRPAKAPLTGDIDLKSFPPDDDELSLSMPVGGPGESAPGLDLDEFGGSGDTASDLFGAPSTGALDLDLEGASTPPGLGLSGPPGGLDLDDLSSDLDLDPGAEFDLAPDPELDQDDDADAPSGVGVFGKPTESGATEPTMADPDEFGDVDLPSEGEIDDLEFSELPEATEAAMAAAPAPGDIPQPRRVEEEIEPRFTWRKLLPLAIGAGFVIAILVAGVSLQATKHGLFGRYFIEQFLPGVGDDALIDRVVADAEGLASSDSYSDVKASLVMLDHLRSQANLNRRLMTRTWIHKALFIARFGDDPKAMEDVVSLKDALEARGSDAPQMDLALAADMLRRKRYQVAAQLVQAAAVRSPNDAYADLILGEASLGAKDAKTAIKAFKLAASKGAGTRAQWGLARAYTLAGEADKATEAVELTLKQSPTHAGAGIAQARDMIAAEEFDKAETLLIGVAGYDPMATLLEEAEEPAPADPAEGEAPAEEEPAGEPSADHPQQEAVVAQQRDAVGAQAPVANDNPEADGKPAAKEEPAEDAAPSRPKVERSKASPAERATALALLGYVIEKEGMRGYARRAYEKAVEIEPSNLSGGLGVARLLMQSGTPNEALSRYEALIQLTAPDDDKPSPEYIEAKLGAGRALLEMKRAPEALKRFQGLEKIAEKDPLIAYWLGKANGAAGKDKQALVYYNKSLELDPANFSTYVALSNQLFEMERPAEALKVLQDAEKSVPINTTVHRLRGDAELARGQLEPAVREYEAAIGMDRHNVDAWLGLARAQRRLGRLDAATDSLARLAKLDPHHSLLAVERGRVAEARLSFADAVASYRVALETAPDDLALKTRLGAALTSVGGYDEAEEILMAVLQEQPYNGEAEHFMGRAALFSHRLARARHHFDRAVRLEPKNGLYRTYLAWAALEQGELGTAQREVNKAIELDAYVGDAYWLRARLLILTGAVRDALKDLKRALELNPDRHEAHAAKAQCYEQLGNLSAAIASYRQALKGGGERGPWLYRLGRLLLDTGAKSEGVATLQRAITLGDEAQVKDDSDMWLAAAHRRLGQMSDKAGDLEKAALHFERYLALAPRGALDRTEVGARLKAIHDKLEGDPFE